MARLSNAGTGIFQEKRSDIYLAGRFFYIFLLRADNCTQGILWPVGKLMKTTKRKIYIELVYHLYDLATCNLGV